MEIALCIITGKVCGYENNILFSFIASERVSDPCLRRDDGPSGLDSADVQTKFA